MEVVRRCKALKVSPQEGEDVISRMPEDVITNIMDRLPLRDAVATSILSTSWRFNWTLLTQLIFDFKFFNTLHGRKIHFDETNIIRILFHLKGGVTNFVLYMNIGINVDVEDVHHWVMFLSRIRGFKELILLNWHQTPVKLPTHLFFWPELKHLKLSNCVLSPPYFSGFPKLLSLELFDVRFQDHEYVELNGKCPLLETLTILNIKIMAGVKWVEIAKLKNVKRLGLSLALLDNVTMVRLSTVFQHLSFLPKLQELYLFLGKFQVI
uniref:F-box/FBD/LRR-repeat protein At1g13570-like n=1 Tax=Erigeron canadensis TaxID=72917 RepID=UPI001CB93FD0|nr:F-box/FBD/LRR-repeat protein At1g13570-like [Erigeron canadensis]